MEDIEKDSGKILCYVVKRERFAKSSKNQFHTEDILYSKLRPYLNKVVFAEKDGFCSSEILPIKFCKSILPKYAYYYLKTSFFLSYANNSSYGVKMPRLGTETGRNALFPIPPLTEQQKIIKSVNLLLEEVLLIEENFGKLFQQVVLSKSKLLDLAIRGKLLPQNPNDEPASALLERIREEQESTKTKRKSIGSYIFKGGDNLYYEQIGSESKCIQDEIPFDIPNSWAWTRLGSICNIVNGFTPNKNNSDFWGNGSIPWFTIQDIRNKGRIVYSTRCKISKAALSKNSERIVPAESLLLCCTASIGEYAISKIALTTNQQFNAITIKKNYSDVLTSNYLFSIAPTFKPILKQLAGATTFEFVSVKKVESILLPLPPLQEQKRISEFLTSAFTKLDSLAQH